MDKAAISVENLRLKRSTTKNNSCQAMFQNIYLHFHRQRFGICPYQVNHLLSIKHQYYPVMILIFGCCYMAFNDHKCFVKYVNE